MLKVWVCVLLFGAASVFSAPVAKRMVDLTYVFDNDTLHYPTFKKFEIKVTSNETHNNTFWLQMEEYSSAIHVGTHMDAPCHLAKGRWCIDKIPLDRLSAPAAVVDIEEKAEADRDYLLTMEDLQQWEKETEQTLNDVILVIRSGWGKRWGDRERFTGTPGNDTTQLHYPGISPEASQWLVDERNIYGVATETLSLDNGPAWEMKAHQILLGANIYGLENVANVDKLPLYGAKLYVMPMKIGNGSGAPTRIVATFPHIVYQSDRKVKALHEVIVFGETSE